MLLLSAVAGPQAEMHSPFVLMDQRIFTKVRVQVLQPLVFITDQTCRQDVFAQCTARFTPQALLMTDEERSTASDCLVSMLKRIAQRNLDDPLAGPNQRQLADELATSCVFLPAELPAPFSTDRWPSLVSIDMSTDYQNWQLAANGIAVTSHSAGDTRPLRQKLGRPALITVDKVADHLTVTATEPRFTAMLQPGHIFRAVLPDNLRSAIRSILQCVQDAYEKMTGMPAGCPEGCKTATATLKSKAWIPAQDDTMFIMPSQLCFTLTDQTGSCRRLDLHLAACLPAQMSACHMPCCTI